MALEALRQRVSVDWVQGADRQAKELLLKTAREGHARILAESLARSGFEPEWVAYANSPGNDNIESVVLPGPIVYQYRYRREIYLETLKLLYKMSPVDSGRYRDSHTLFVNGVPAQTGIKANPTDEVWIANPQPYARRLEVGKTTSGRDFLVSVPNRIYERAAKQIQQRYRGAATVEFGYISIPGAYVIKGRLPSHYIAKGGIRRRRRQPVGQPVRAPAIFISALS